MSPHDRESSTTILRLPQVKMKTGLGRSTIYAQQEEGIFPPSISLGARAVGWLETEVEAVIRARSLGHSDAMIRQLVALLVAERRTGGSAEHGTRPVDPEDRPDNWLSDPPSRPLTEAEMKFIDWLCDEAVKEWVAEHVAQRASAVGRTETSDRKKPASRPRARDQNST